jgi:hypothetical protein
MQIVMCCYGFIVYKETPESIRKTRRAYIICSWVILVFFSLSQSADAVETFLLLADSKSSIEAIAVVKPKVEYTWWRVCATAGLWFVSLVGDGLLVGHADLRQSMRKFNSVAYFLGLEMLPCLV